MKVLHFKTNYLNISETFINRFVRHHQAFEPIVATCNPQFYTENISIHAMPQKGLKGLWNHLQLQLNRTPSFLYDVVSEEKPDIIHGHFGLDSYRLLALKRATNIPLVVNFYGYDVIRLPQEFGWKKRYQKLADEADLFFVVSQDMKQNVINLGFPEDKIKVLKLALNPNDITFKQRHKAGGRLMMVGRMVEKKGFPYAIQAVHQLKEQGVNVLLDIYGDGKNRSSIETLISNLNLENQIILHGQTSNKNILDALYDHDILLVPSVQAEDGDREGMPQTAVEGMASGIPVVASDHAGLAELIIHEQTGLQVPERDSSAIANAIQRYCNDQTLVSDISKQGRVFIEKEHDIVKQVKKAETYYRRLTDL